MKDLRYPIGTFTMPATHDAAQRAAWIEALAALPEQLRAAVAGLGDRELAQSYREGGWTRRFHWAERLGTHRAGVGAGRCGSGANVYSMCRWWCR